MEPVTVVCKYCKRNIDGVFHGDAAIDKSQIFQLGSNKVIAVVGEYQKKKCYLHTSCKTGIEAEEALQK